MTDDSATSRLQRALTRVRREDFLSPALRAQASADAPLSIGEGQTISQPSLVAYMTRLLDPSPASRVLEIGTGSGYQTALLAELAADVYTIERLPRLAAAARARLLALHYGNIHFRVGDGALGWPEAAPFDRVMLTAAAARLPAAVLAQLAPGGKLVGPVGAANADWQTLVLVERNARGEFTTRELEPVRFVPLVTAT
jgi:protein-L-isoaspartate(D-aspartate) O-methyltransferase